jgi:hypothetical protein
MDLFRASLAIEAPQDVRVLRAERGDRNAARGHAPPTFAQPEAPLSDPEGDIMHLWNRFPPPTLRSRSARFAGGPVRRRAQGELQTVPDLRVEPGPPVPSCRPGGLSTADDPGLGAAVQTGAEGGWDQGLLVLLASFGPLLLYPITHDHFRWWSVALTTVFLMLSVLMLGSRSLAGQVSAFFEQHRKLALLVIGFSFLIGGLGIVSSFGIAEAILDLF